MNFMSAARLIFILQYSFENACCIDCYQCRSDTHQGCNPPISDDYLRTCPLKNLTVQTRSVVPFCRQIHQILYFTKNHDEAYVRECGYLPTSTEEECRMSRFPHTGYQVTCQCFTDACNHAAARAGPKLTVAAITAVAVAVVI